MMKHCAAAIATTAVVLCAAAMSTSVLAQDPAEGWTAYLTATCPAGTYLTHFEAKWTNLDNPTMGGGFWSPWIGSDTSDNLDLIQPVNPWLGNSWAIYSEHFNWVGPTNSNSPQQPSYAGDTIHGVISYLGDSQNAYQVTQNDITNPQSSTLYARVPQGKQFTVLYVVLEKVMMSCQQYSPNGVVTFYDMKVFCSGRQVFPEWTAGHVDHVCNMQAHVLNKTAVSITWDVNAPPPTADKIALNDKSKRRFVPLTKKK